MFDHRRYERRRGEAGILVGRRSLLDKIFEPLRMLRENVTAQ